MLVVEDVDLEAKLLMRALADSGYSNLVHKPDVESALAEIESNPPRIVITDLQLDKSTGVELTKRIRARASDAAYIYVVMLTSSGSDTVLEKCFDAGVDDFVEKPFHPEEICARLRAGERILGLETTLRAKSRELETALRRIDISAMQRALAAAAESTTATVANDCSPLDALLGSEPWRDVEALLVKSMSDFFQISFDSVRSSSTQADRFVAEVSLLEPTRQIEATLSVVVDNPSMGKLAAHLLGDEEMEGAQALVLEVANILMGALKTAFVPLGFTFTGGIPSAVPFAQARMGFEKSQVRSRSVIGAEGSEVELWLQVKEKKNTTLRGKDLREGLVVTNDIRDDKGMLLIKGGSRLTQTAASRIAKVAPELEIEVSDPNG